MGKNNIAEFLYNSAASLPITTRSYQLLKSYYLTRSRLSIPPDESSLNTKFSNENICNKCSTLRSDGQFSIKIDPIKCKGKSIRKKLQHRIKYDHGDMDEKTTSTPISMKNLKRYCNNTAKIKCSVCSDIAKVNIFVKSKALPPSPGNNTNCKKSKIASTDVGILPPKRIPEKKLKKDKTSGLKIPNEITSNTLSIDDKQNNIPNNQSAEILKLMNNKNSTVIIIDTNSRVNTLKNQLMIENKSIINKCKSIERKKLIPKQNLTKSKLNNKAQKSNLRLLAIALKEKNNTLKNENLALAKLLTKNNESIK